jgi:hypothetical protein
MSNKQGSLGDRYAEIAVVLVTIVALLAGWFYKSSIENASVPFSAEGVSVQAPKGWLQTAPEGNEILRTLDMNSSGFGATYVVSKIAIAEEVSLTEITGFVALDHANSLTAFRVMDQQEVTVNGRTAYELSYVFVSSNPDMTQAQMPSVVRGTDYIFLNGDHAIVISFQADEKNYDLDLSRFHLFLKSLNF